jgi:hypothetical protein
MSLDTSAAPLTGSDTPRSTSPRAMRHA